MNHAGLWIGTLGLAMVACTDGGTNRRAPQQGTLLQASGEPRQGFPSWYERTIHVLTNRARADPQADLAGCTRCPEASCYAAVGPVEWDYDHNRAARFHATHLTQAGCGMAHASPCALVADIGSIYPDSCDGNTACVCQEGSADCSDAVSPANTDTWTRLAQFGVSGGARAENVAGRRDPFAIFYGWLHEASSSSNCVWAMENGHRWSILNGALTRLGVGASSSYTVQDFSSNGALTQKIPSGGHFPESPAAGAAIDLRANWFDTSGPRGAFVNIDGTCSTMLIERGSENNGTYLRDVTAAGGCQRYYFLFTVADGSTVTYPDTGSFGINCAADWSSSRPAEGAGCPGAASCGNSSVEHGETCDPPSTCPTDCDDGISCTTDLLTGSAANCNAACVHTNIASCADADGCCPSGCTFSTDADCAPSPDACVEPCDDGGTSEPDAQSPPPDASADTQSHQLDASADAQSPPPDASADTQSHQLDASADAIGDGPRSDGGQRNTTLGGGCAYHTHAHAHEVLPLWLLLGALFALLKQGGLRFRRRRPSDPVSDPSRQPE